MRSIAGVRGEEYRFEVASNIPQNSGSRSAGIGFTKLSLVFGPWNRTEFFLNAGEGLHSNDTHGVVASVDPKTFAPVSPATPFGPRQGRGDRRPDRSDTEPPVIARLLVLAPRLGACVQRGQWGDGGQAGRRSASAWNGQTTTRRCHGCFSIWTLRGLARGLPTTTRSAIISRRRCRQPRRQALPLRTWDPGAQAFLDASSARVT